MSETSKSYNVMVLGGEGCGKTSILAALYKSFHSASEGTLINMDFSFSDMMTVMEDKLQEMSSFYKSCGRELFNQEENATGTVQKYQCIISLDRKKGSEIKVNFIDFPGKWLTEPNLPASIYKDIVNSIEVSDILIITVDTPYLYECGGKYNSRNGCDSIADMIEASRFIDSGKPRIILFVPIKCERYYNNECFNNVAVKIKSSYKKIIDMCSGDKNKNIFIGVTPIITMGSLEFSHFELNDEGRVSENEETGLPEKEVYFFSSSSDEPQFIFCEQPLIYMLSFICMLAAPTAEKKGFDLFGLLKKNSVTKEDFEEQSRILSLKYKTGGDGYAVLKKGILIR